MIENVLLTATPIATFYNGAPMTNASGFFFERDQRLYVVTSQHVLIDEVTDHRPDMITIEFHTDRNNLAEAVIWSIPLYRDGIAVWHQALDTAGEVDVAVLEVDRQALPHGTFYEAFTPDHLPGAQDHIEVGSAMLIVGFPLGFHDTLHHLPVVRQAVNASTFAFRFEGNGYFLTDGRTHRGTSGAAVVRRKSNDETGAELPWQLLGVHSARLDVGTRDLELDEALGLNVAWFSDILMTLTA